MEAFELLFQGFLTLMTVQKLALMMVGLILGVFVGVLPGLGGPNGVAILLPLTFSMEPTSAIVMLSCITMAEVGSIEKVSGRRIDRKSTRLNSSHQIISYAVFCL